MIDQLITWPWIGPIGAGLALLAVIGLFVHELRRPYDPDYDERCDRVDRDLDDRERAARRAALKPVHWAPLTDHDIDSALDFTWPDTPTVRCDARHHRRPVPVAPAHDPEFAPLLNDGDRR